MDQLYGRAPRRNPLLLEVAICGWGLLVLNEERIHGELDDRTPAEVEAAYHRDHPRERVA